jgi:fatty-acyl-CoA synthase
VTAGRIAASVMLLRSGVDAYLSSGLTIPWRPLTLTRLSRDLLAFGLSPAIGYAGGADRHPGAVAVLDPTLPAEAAPTFAAAEQLTRNAAQWLVDSGWTSRSAIGVLGRNSAAFAVAVAAVGRTGADLFYLNTGFAPAQLADVALQHGIGLVLVDPEFADRVPDGIRSLLLPAMLACPPAEGLGPAVSGGRHIILTSGTTGRPKGADRSATPIQAAVAMLARLPYRERGTHVLAAPMFHSWGWLNHRLASLLDATEVMVPRAGADAILDAAEAHRADLIVTTPVAVRRMAAAGPGDRDLSSLHGVLVSGALLPPDTVERFQARFGPVLYNLYGSTEAGFATVATPDDLLAFPATAGRPMPGVSVRVLDDDGNAVPDGHEGQLWVGSQASFSGYIDGADAERRAGLVATGDAGRIAADGLVFVHGRADDLIISGGENVHPAEVETALGVLPRVADIAAVGVPDERFGQRVVVHVVPAADADPDRLAAEVMAQARQMLAPYQRPRAVVIRDSLPHNETGKVERHRL